MMLYTKYESSGPCSFRQDCILKTSFLTLCIKYESSWPCSLRQEDFVKLHFENINFGRVTSLCNQSKPFEQFW